MLRSFAAGRLFGSLSGDGPPRVLALHGWGRSHRDFDAVLGRHDGEPALAALALDLPGFGSSPAPPAPWGPAEYAACVAEVLAEMATPVVVLGHSYGGRVAVHLAAARPAEVAGLVVTGSPLLRRAQRRRPAARYRLVRRLHRLGLVGEARMEAARQRHGSADYRAAQGVMRQVHVRSVNESDEEALRALRCPLRLVWGEDDPDVPLAVAEQVAAMVGAELTVCPGAGHLTPLTAPAALRSALEQCLV